MDKLNILVLHSLGNPEVTANFLNQHVFALKNCFPQHNYIYHDTALPIPAYVREAAFHAIILDVTFLCARWSFQKNYLDLKRKYAFVQESEAFKIALPQDEYDCCEVLDDWMCDWRVDVVFSVISSNWQVLYPRFSQVGRIELGYTGFIDAALIEFERCPYDRRSIDIGYRARKLPPYFGRIGQTKWTIGRDVLERGKDVGLNLDIVLGDQGTLYGNVWLDFINQCKFTLGANSGSSLLDPRGHIQRKVKSYFAENPLATFEAVEAACFMGLDGQFSFTAISPRILEAGLLESCQILVEGEYSGIIQPWDHYIPIRPDASNFNEVLKAMQNHSLVEKMIKNCRNTLLGIDCLRSNHQTQQIINLIIDSCNKKQIASDYGRVQMAASRYKDEMPSQYQALWRRQGARRRMITLVDQVPAVSKFFRWVRSHD